MSPTAIILLAAFWLAVAAAIVAIFAGRTKRLSIERRVAPDAPEAQSVITESREKLTAGVAQWLERKGFTARLASGLENAGMTVTPAAFVVRAAVVTIAAIVGGAVLGGFAVALLFGVSAMGGIRFWLQSAAGRRRNAFADQLDDTLQLMSGSVRAGHSVLRALDAVAQEAEAPTSVEFHRIVNETRVGRELTDAFNDCADRMQSEDFKWVSQAIAIQREVGGNLSEVLDSIGGTIRERNQIRRQVKSLSAEGKLSGIVLMLLPVGISGFLFMSNPGYISKLTSGPMGWAMLIAALVMMGVGGFWLKKVVSFKF